MLVSFELFFTSFLAKPSLRLSSTIEGMAQSKAEAI